MQLGGKMKKSLIIMLVTVMLLIGCTKTPILEEPKEDDFVVVSKIADGVNQQKVIEVLGKPFLSIGGQIRLDGLLNRGEGEHTPPEGAPKALTIAEVEPYIKEAKNMGLTVLQIPIEWRHIEPQKDTYDFTIVSDLLTLINKYDLKMEILWFSTNMTGDVHSFHIPNYIWQDDVNYPKMYSFINDQQQNPYWSWMYGEVGYMVLDHPNLLERESKVLENLMGYIYEWNQSNNLKYPVIGVQIHNESD